MYSIHELLTDEDIQALSREAFAPRKRSKHLLRWAAGLAACAVLVLMLSNPGVVAAGVQRVWSYFTGAGIAESGSCVLIQSEPITWELDGRSYTITGALEKDGVLTLPVLLHTELEMTGDAGFHMVLLENGRPCPTIWGDDAEISVTPFQTEALWEQNEAAWGYQTPRRYQGSGSFAGTAPSFYTQGSGNYTVELRRGRAQGFPSDPAGEPLTAPIVLTAPDTLSFREYSRPQDGGKLVVLVSEDGRRASFYLDGGGGELFLRCPYDLWFVDAAGERYRGVMESGPASHPGQSVEVRLETEPGQPITAIEVGGLLLSRMTGSGTFLGYADRPALHWTITLA